MREGKSVQNCQESEKSEFKQVRKNGYCLVLSKYGETENF